MMIELILGLALIAVGLIAAISYSRMRAVIEKYKSFQGEQLDQEGKLSTLRKEIGTLKEDLQRKSRALEEARENARKKQRKEAQKSESFVQETTGDNSELERLRQALRAMEAQVQSVKKESEMTAQQTTQDLQKEYLQQIEDLKSQVKSLKSEISGRGEAKKRSAKMAGVVAELENLPADVVSEFARLARKAEQHEKLHSLAQGKFQLAQERFAELQKRYFAVCRELALAIGQDEKVTEEEARANAEELVKSADLQQESTQSSDS